MSEEVPVSQAQTDAGAYPVPYIPRRERPRVVVKADLLPAVSVLSMIGLLGIPLGWLWSKLAPAQQVRVLRDGSVAPLPSESFHSFDGMVIFAFLGLGAGLLVGVAVWFLRERRGPVVLFAAVAGSVLAAWLAMRMGTTFVGSSYAISGTPQVGDVLPEPPTIESGWVVVAQPLTTALAYGMLAGWNGLDDLGRRLG